MTPKIIKEIIIMLLVCLVTMLLLAIILYKFIPNNKVIPEIVEYAATDDVRDLLEDTIDSTSTNSVIMTYEVTASDLNVYQVTKDYVPGKSNPFAKSASSETSSEAEEAKGESKTTESKAETKKETSSQSSVLSENKTKVDSGIK